MKLGTSIALPVLALAVLLAVPALGSHVYGVPVLYRGSMVGCAEQPRDLVAELVELYGDRVAYLFGIRGCPECAEMERYLRDLLLEGELAYVDILDRRELFEGLLNSLRGFVEDKYLAEVPVVLVQRDGSLVLVSIGVFRNDTYWRSVLSGERSEQCRVRLVERAVVSPVWLIAWALALGAASALSPCVLYLYMSLALSASAGGSPSRLLSFVLGLGLGYFLVVLGLRGLLALFRPYAWTFFIAFGIYMILHSRGFLGCPVGGRACRDVGFPRSGPLIPVLGSLFPLLLGLVASLSATPCSAGYFVLLQATADAGPLASAVSLAYVGAFVAPYLAFSILSGRILGAVGRLASGAPLVELIGGIALVAAGVYLALGA